VVALNYYRYCPYDGERLLIDPKVDEQHPSCPLCGFVDYHNPRPCVAILILKNDKVLLARRAVEPAKGKWDIPGGFMEPGESAEEAVVREALEETNLLVRVTGFLGSLSDVYGDRKWPTINLCFAVEAEDGEPQPLSDVESLSWFAFDQLPKDMAFAHQYQMLQWCRERAFK
jgi:mutator protein MutT